MGWAHGSHVMGTVSAGGMISPMYHGDVGTDRREKRWRGGAVGTLTPTCAGTIHRGWILYLWSFSWG